MLNETEQQVKKQQKVIDKAYCNYNGNEFELKIDRWKDYDGEQIQIQSNGKNYLVSTNNCYLVEE